MRGGGENSGGDLKLEVPPEESGQPRRSFVASAVTLLVATTFFMEMLDGSVIATALPQIGRSLQVSAVDLNIGITAYLLALAALIPVSGWIANRIGARTVFAGAIAVFTLASLLCALSHSLLEFTAARVLQGAGGAAMVPVGRLIVLRTTRKENLVQAIGTIVWPGLVAPVLGPPLGGLIVMHLSWPWIFYLNLPLGAAALALVFLLIAPDKAAGEPRPLDVVGFVLSGAALCLLVYGMGTAGEGPRRIGLGLAAIGLGLAGLIAAVRHLCRHPAPLLNLSAFRIPTFRVVAQGGSLLRISIGALPFLLPLLFQLGFGFSPVASGTLLLFVFAGNLAMKLFTTPILRMFGFRSIMIGNGVLAALAIGACALLTRDTPFWLIAAVLFAGGLFRSMQFTCLATIQFADVPADRMADASTLASMMQQLMLGLGVTVGAALLNASAWIGGRSGQIPGVGDFQLAFVVLMIVALLGLIDSVGLDPAAGRNISGHAAAS